MIDQNGTENLPDERNEAKTNNDSLKSNIESYSIALGNRNAFNTKETNV